MTQIVFLDAFTLNPGDLDWRALAALGNLTHYDRTAPEDVLPRALHADILIVNKVVLTANTLSQLPRLKGIVVAATGYNNIDVAAARAKGIPVCNAVGYGPDAVAQHAFALLLALTNQVSAHHQSVQRGEWSAQPDFCYLKTPTHSLQGRTLGLLGLGKIGTRVALIARAFGMSVLAVRGNPDTPPPDGVQVCPLESMLPLSDVVCLTAPLTPQTRGIIQASTLQRMRRHALLINVARGELVVESDLRDALLSGTIAGAGLDVLDGEPPRADHPLFGLPNCIITPHIAWMATESRQRLMAITVDNVKMLLNQTPQNVVN
jgi:glycerate dehydrogenase